MTKGTCTTCPYCGVGCGVIASPDGTISGDPDHPANAGRLCSKGSALGETIGLEGRLLHPVVDGQKTDWASAMDRVAGEFTRAISKHGPDSVAFYVSGQLLTEDYYVANKLMKGFIGSANIDTNSRLCMASSVAGHRRAFGTDTVPGQYADLEDADVVVLVGSNLAWCHPVLFQRLAAAKAARPSMQVVLVDPRETATAQIADLHLAIRPDGDAALFNALLAEISARGLIDAAYTRAHVDGLDDALRAAQVSDPAGAGVSPAKLRRFLDLWCGSEKVVTLYSQGVNQSACGTDKVNAILNCHLATGRIGRPGMGPFSITGQPNAMGGREVGGLANMLACHLDLENAAHRAAVRDFWDAPRVAGKPGLKAVDLFHACADGRIKALWIMSTNPVVSMPEADRVAEAIAAVPFTVVSDVLPDTDTARLADVLLPATAWGEKSGTVTNSERCISRQRPFLPAPGQARPDWAIIAEVGRRMGWRAAFDFRSEAEVFAEFAAMSGLARDFGRDFDITGLAGLGASEYDALRPQVWPVPNDRPGTPRFFANGGFFHKGGRAKMLPIVPPLQKPNASGFYLNTGRVRDQWHTMTRSGRSPRLGGHLAEPFLEIHPDDAAAIGLSAAEICEVSNGLGTARLRVLLSDRVAPGAPFAPMHWTGVQSSAGRINALVAADTDPFSGQPALKAGAVEIHRFEAAWYGFAAGNSPMAPIRPYAAVARSRSGWRAEVAGCKTPRDWVAEARAVLGISGGDAVLVQDAANSARVALRDNDRLLGLFFAGPEPVAVARDHAISLIGTNTPPLEALAGIPPADRPDAGVTVCTCLEVGANTLRLAVEDGARTVEALGACTGAGTNCGSCRPELQAIIAGVPYPPLVAE